MKIKIAALIVTLSQLLLACIATGQIGFEKAYVGLCQFDCGWYASITEFGYHSTIPPVSQNGNLANVAFFPGYPYLARMLHLLLGLDVRWSLLIVAHLSCWLFWIAFLSILNFWKVEGWVSAVAVFAVLSHPASFYVVAGYSESLFLSSFLGFIYFTYLGTQRSSVHAALSGFMMSATRIFGIPLAVFPLLQRPLIPLNRNELKRRVGVAFISAMGAGVFFLYCQIRFGEFNLYMWTQRVGWGVAPDYLAIFKYPYFNSMTPWDMWTAHLTYLAIPLVFGVEGLIWYFKKASQFRVRLPLYFSAVVTFYFTISGLRGLNGMVRYSFVWTVLLILCGAHLVSQMAPVSFRVRMVVLCIAALFLGYSFCNFQYPHLVDYLHGRWFA